MYRVITTVGTSLFTNYLENDDSLEIFYNALKNRPHSQWQSSQPRIGKLKPPLIAWAREKDDASAEIKRLLRIQQELNDDLEVYLLASDTVLSRLAAGVIQERFAASGNSSEAGTITARFDPERDVIPGMQVADRQVFEQEGLYHLISRIEQIITYEDYVDSENTVLNITGGYKAVIPYLTLTGQVFNIPLYYIFEDTDELIKIPQAPVNINWGLFEKYEEVFQQLDEGIEGDWVDFKRRHNIQEDFQACIWSDGEVTGLSAIGKMFWKRYLNYFVVEVPKGSHFFTDKPGNRTEIQKALQELYQRLRREIDGNSITGTGQLLHHIQRLGSNNDLRHGDNPGKNKFIFKSTNKSHVRVVYEPEMTGSGSIKIKMYDYKRGDFDHGAYIREFKQKWKAMAEPQFVKLAFRKGEV